MIKKSDMTLAQAVDKFTTDKDKITVVATLNDWDGNKYIFTKSYKMPENFNGTKAEKLETQIDNELAKNDDIEGIQEMVICYNGEKFGTFEKLADWMN